MQVYFLVSFLFMINVLLSTLNYQKYKLFVQVVNFYFAIFLVVFSGLRLPGSSFDDHIYISYFNDFNISLDILYMYLNRIVGYFSDDVALLFLFISFISVSFFYLSGSIFDPRYLALMLFLYCCHIYLYRDMIQIRAAVAYNVLLLSMVYGFGSQIKKSIFFWFVSIGFHKTTMIWLFSYFYYKIKFKTNYLVLLAFLLWITTPLKLGSSIIGFLLAYIPDGLSVIVDTYLNESSVFVYQLSMLNPTTTKVFVYFIIFSYFRNDANKIYEKYDLLYYSYFISLCFLCFFSDFAVFASRFSSLFSMSELIIIPVLISISRGYLKVGLLAFFVLSASMQLVINLMFKGVLNEYGTILF